MPSYPAPKMTAAQFRRLLLAQVGKPYVLGAEAAGSDSNPPRFDCSELVEWSFCRNCTPIPDLAATQYDRTRAVTGPLRVGDLVFLRNNPARWNGIGHVAILTAKLSNGDWEIVEARGRASGVVKSTLSYWRTRRYYVPPRRLPSFSLRPAGPVVITETQIRAGLDRAGALGKQVQSLAELAAGATAALNGLHPNGHAQAAFLATMAQESAWFRTTVEYGSAVKRYDPYRGRTFEQVTWRDNYAAFGAWAFARKVGGVAAADHFVTNPAELADLRYAWLGGTWYWEARTLWPYAAAGDFQRVQNAVNRGNPNASGFPAGWKTRLKAYQGFLSAIDRPSMVTVDGDFGAKSKARAQEHIGVEIDGDWADRSKAALAAWLGVQGKPWADVVRALQTKVGATPDGDWDAKTTEKFQTYLNNHR